MESKPILIVVKNDLSDFGNCIIDSRFSALELYLASTLRMLLDLLRLPEPPTRYLTYTCSARAST